MNTLISKLLGTTVGVKIGNNTIIGLLVGVAWDENLQISELSLSPSENIVHYPILFYKRKQMQVTLLKKLLKNQNLTM